MSRYSNERDVHNALVNRATHFAKQSRVFISDGQQSDVASSKFHSHAGPYEVVDRVGEQTYTIKGADDRSCPISAHRLRPCKDSRSYLHAHDELAASALGPYQRFDHDTTNGLFSRV